MNVTTRITAAAQVLLSIVFLVGYFTILVMFLLGHVHVAPVWRDQLGVLLGVLTAGVVTVVQVWFARHRAQEPPNAPPAS